MKYLPQAVHTKIGPTIFFNLSKSWAGQVARWFIKDKNISLLSISFEQGTKKWIYTIETILANALVAANHSHQTWVCCSRTKEMFKKHKIYKDLSYQAFVDILDALEKKGFIEQRLGYKDWSTGKLGRRTIYRATKQLRDILFNFQHLVPSDGKKGLAYYTDDQDRPADIDEDRSLTLKALNTENQKYKWELGDLPISPPEYHSVLKTHVVKSGGRIYTDIQNLPKHKRKQVKINGLPTREVDIKGSHFALLYASVNKPSPDDPYHLKQYSIDDNLIIRPLVKLASVVFLNAIDRNSALMALRNELNTIDYLNKDNMSISMAYNHYANLITTHQGTHSVRRTNSPEVLSNLLGDLSSTHTEISRFFCSNAGLWLMAIEGEMAISCLKMAATAGIAAVNIHDGYLVQADKVDHFKAIVERVLQDVGKVQNGTVEVDVPPPSIKQITLNLAEDLVNQNPPLPRMSITPDEIRVSKNLELDCELDW